MAIAAVTPKCVDATRPFDSALEVSRRLSVYVASGQWGAVNSTLAELNALVRANGAPQSERAEIIQRVKAAQVAAEQANDYSTWQIIGMILLALTGVGLAVDAAILIDDGTSTNAHEAAKDEIDRWKRPSLDDSAANTMFLALGLQPAVYWNEVAEMWAGMPPETMARSIPVEELGKMDNGHREDLARAVGYQCSPEVQALFLAKLWATPGKAGTYYDMFDARVIAHAMTTPGLVLDYPERGSRITEWLVGQLSRSDLRSYAEATTVALDARARGSLIAGLMKNNAPELREDDEAILTTLFGVHGETDFAVGEAVLDRLDLATLAQMRTDIRIGTMREKLDAWVGHVKQHTFNDALRRKLVRAGF